jgi:hypothetical protein
VLWREKRIGQRLAVSLGDAQARGHLSDLRRWVDESTYLNQSQPRIQPILGSLKRQGLCLRQQDDDFGIGTLGRRRTTQDRRHPPPPCQCDWVVIVGVRDYASLILRKQQRLDPWRRVRNGAREGPEVIGIDAHVTTLRPTSSRI